jgi:hypothetical protein
MRIRFGKACFILGFVLAPLAFAVGPGNTAEPADIKTTTGVVTAIEDRGTIIIYGSLKFYPAVEIRRKHQWPRPGVPEWIRIGSEVSISYYERGFDRYFLDLVRPGEKFPVKEAVESALRTPH